MQVKSPLTPAMPLLLESLPDHLELEDGCPRRAKMQIDLLLLAIEALDLDGAEAILTIAKDLELQPVLKNRVTLWRIRSANPLRRYGQRRPMSAMEAKALVLIVCHLARRLTVLLRQLLLGYQQLSEKQLSPEHHFRLSDYLERFRVHFRARMNPRRAANMAYETDDQLNQLALTLLEQLLFCTGTYGPQRLWSSLFDGEVA